MGARRARDLVALCLASSSVLVGCKAILGADGYEVVRCGEALNPDPQLVASCLLQASCSPYTPVWTISTCITFDAQEAFGGSLALTSVTSCPQVWEIEGVGFVEHECDGKSAGWYCDSLSNRVLRCGDYHNGGFYRDCTHFGGTCQVFDNNGPQADCQVLDHCPDSSPGAHCSNSLLYRCLQQKAFGQDCARIPAACSTWKEETNCFLGAPIACAGAVPACNQNTAQQCFEGRLLKYNCAKAGLQCAPNGSGVCLAQGCEIQDLKNCVESCEGVLLKTCVGGAPFRIDCTTFGFSTCRSGFSEQLGDYATCAFE